MGGPGSGRKRLPVAEHLRRGTYRPDRHGPRPQVAPALASPAAAGPPSGLGAGGRRLWSDFLDRFTLEAGELALLTEACRRVDELDRLSAGLRGSEVTSADDKGNLRANPVLRELRGHTAVLAALLKQLKVEAPSP